MPRNHHLPSKAAKQQKAGRPNPIWLWVGLGIGAIAVVAFFLFQPKATSAVVEISVAQAYEKYQQGVFFVDVRTNEEWDEMHVANSVLIPLDELPNRLSEIPRDRDVVVVCRSGRRSKEAAGILQNAGYSNIVSMTGGLTAWKAAGYPLE